MTLRCDFCSSDYVRWSYPARDFAIEADTPAGKMEWGSAGDFAACDLCHAIIERGDRVALSRRTVEILSIPPILADEVARFHTFFFEHRTGPAMPVV
jgi:transcriptional regulator GlxA family with amidase domain